MRSFLTALPYFACVHILLPQFFLSGTKGTSICRKKSILKKARAFILFFSFRSKNANTIDDRADRRADRQWRIDNGGSTMEDRQWRIDNGGSTMAVIVRPLVTVIARAGV
jgi:hypothetical protein